jgi:hypothetical protein
MTTTDFNPALAGAKVSWLRVLRSEWIKFWSIRSTYIIFVLAIFFMVGLGALIAYGISTAIGEGEFEGPATRMFDSAWLSLQGIGLAQLAIGVLGVLTVTGEYSTGMVRATFSAVPRRIPVLTAKAALIIITVVLIMAPAAFAAFFVAQGILANQGLDAQISDPGVARAVFGASLYLAMVGVIGCALGWLLRSAAGAIFALVVVLILLPVLLPLIQLDWVQNFSEYLPSTAGQTIYTVDPDNLMSRAMQGGVRMEDILGGEEEPMKPWVGFGILVAWAVVALGAAGALLLRRDA